MVNFCIFNGWANPLLNYALYAFRAPTAIRLANEALYDAPVEYFEWGRLDEWSRGVANPVHAVLATLRNDTGAARPPV